jgi:hypothetical protein
LRRAIVPLGTQSQLSNLDDLVLGEGATVAFAVVQRLLDVGAVCSAYYLELLPTLTDRDHLWTGLVQDVGVRFDPPAEDSLPLAEY